MVLDDIAELLAVGGAAARIGIEHDVALGGHPLKFMVEGVTVGGMRAAVDIEDQRILLAGREMGRTLHPGLDAAAVEALVPDRLRFGQVELGEQLVVNLGEAFETAGRAIEQEQVADIRGRRNQDGGLRSIGRGAVGEDVLVAAGERIDFAGFRVDTLEVGAPLFGGIHEDAATVRAPVGIR